MHLRSTRKTTEMKYLEAVESASSGIRGARTRDISKALGVSPSSVTPMLVKLSGRGLIEYEPYRGARLTKKGRASLRDLSQREAVLDKFFLLVGMGRDVSRVHAKRLGTIVSDEGFRKLKILNEKLEMLS